MTTKKTSLHPRRRTWTSGVRDSIVNALTVIQMPWIWPWAVLVPVAWIPKSAYTLWTKASASIANTRDISAETVPSPLPLPTAIVLHKPERAKPRKKNQRKSAVSAKTESVPPTPKIKASKRKITGEELIELVKDADNDVKDYIIQNVFMKQDF